MHQKRNLLRVAPIDKTKPIGIHAPQLEGDVGWDLEAMEDVTIPPMQALDVPVNAKAELPIGVWALIHNRSSMGRKRNLYVDMNVIDNGYRGPLFVQIRNMNLPIKIGAYGQIRARMHDDDQSVTIKAGERIGQLVFYRAAPVWVKIVPEIDEQTERGPSGFGSTGV